MSIDEMIVNMSGHSITNTTEMCAVVKVHFYALGKIMQNSYNSSFDGMLCPIVWAFIFRLFVDGDELIIMTLIT